MTARRTLCLVLLAIGSAALVAPAGAMAEVRCVPNQGAQCDSSHGTIGGAVAAAGTSDTILIGPGTRFASITTSKRLRFEGAGAKATTIRSLNGPALRLRGGGTVTSLAARGGPGAAEIAIDPAALGKLAFNVTGVSAQGGNEANAGDWPGSGLAVTADVNERPTVFVDGGTFRAGAGDGFYYAGLSFAGDATRAELEGVEAIGLDGNGIRTSADAELEMTDTVASGRVGAALGDGDYQVRRSRLEGALCGLCASDQGQQTSTVLLENSLVIAIASGAVDEARALSAIATGPGGNVHVTARGATLLSAGDDPQAAVYVEDPTAVGTAKVDLVGSIADLAGPREPGEADLVADRDQITASRSSFATRAVSNGGSVTEPGTAGNVGDAMLGPDFSPMPGSPAIDSGDPALTGLDLIGRPRNQDGNGDGVAAPDMGAFEVAPGAGLGSAAPVVSRFRIARKVLTRKRRRTRFRFRLSEAARVVIRIERLAGTRRGKPRFVSVRTLRSGEKGGAQSVKFRAPKRLGRYRARLRATDDQGARSSEKRLRFRVARAPG